jgi:hypothetical protein
MEEIIGFSKFEALFRKAASLDIDKSDLKRFIVLINEKISDLFIIANAAAKANERVIIQLYDLPITKGIQEDINEFKKYDDYLELTPVLEKVVTMPQLNITYSEEVEKIVIELVWALSVISAKILKVINPNLKNPTSEDWEKVRNLFDILQ